MIINIVFITLECVKLLLVLCGILGLKHNKKAILSWVVFGVCVMCLVIKGAQDSDYRVSTFLYLSVIICALQIESKRRWIISFLSYLGICCMDELIYSITKLIFSVSDEVLKGNSVFFLGVSSVSVYVVAIVALLLSKLGKRRRYSGTIVQGTNVFYLVLCTLGLFSVTFVLSAFCTIDFVWNRVKLQVIAGCICTLGIVFLLLWMLLIHNNDSKKNYKKIAEMNERLLEEQEKYYQMLLEKENETRRFRHDISNHILCLDVLLKEQEYQEAEGYLDSLKGSLQDLGPRIHTGNNLVNAILNDISNKYKNVMLDWNGHLPQKMQLPNADVCTIFSNILENAFYAAASCEGEGRVDVTVQEVGQGLKVLVKNNMAKPVDEKEGRFISQKADKKNHGLGTLNVRDCVNRNGGSVEYNYTDNLFTAKIVLLNGL